MFLYPQETHFQTLYCLFPILVAIFLSSEENKKLYFWLSGFSNGMSTHSLDNDSLNANHPLDNANPMSLVMEGRDIKYINLVTSYGRDTYCRKKVQEVATQCIYIQTCEMSLSYNARRWDYQTIEFGLTFQDYQTLGRLAVYCAYWR